MASHRKSKTVAPARAATMLARLSGERAVVERVFAVLSESLDPDDVACSLYETDPDHWTVAVHARNALDAATLQALVADTAGHDAAAALSFETVADTDWIQQSLAGLTPVTAGRFVIHGAHHRGSVAANRIGIEIEAALAFGTGHHGTTRGCLLAFERLTKSRQPRRILDVGTGTGVLAIAAARTMRRRVIASDIDSHAVRTARANVRLNRAAPFVEVLHAAGLTHRAVRAHRYDLVFANILLGPLQRLAVPIGRITAAHGRVILSGLLPAHANAAQAAYGRQGLVLERKLLVDGWLTLTLRRGR